MSIILTVLNIFVNLKLDLLYNQNIQKVLRNCFMLFLSENISHFHKLRKDIYKIFLVKLM